MQPKFVAVQKMLLKQKLSTDESPNDFYQNH
ncbi:Uncharacterised protein [Escherichia coli]|nr:Uncharacterised protein [Escherichia coli]